MRKAVAKLDGIEGGDVDIDYAAKTCSIRVQEGDPSVEEIVAAVNGASRFTLTAK